MMKILHNVHRNIIRPFSEIANEPIIITITDISDAILDKFYRDYKLSQQTGQEYLPIIINSDGGHTNVMASIISCFEASEIPVVTIGTGRMYSAALILLSFGTPGYRYCCPNSFGFMHEFSATLPDGDSTSDELKFEYDCMKKENNNMYKKMALRCGQKANFFLDLISESTNKQLYMTPKQMKQYGIVDVIKIPTITIDVDVRYNIK